MTDLTSTTMTVEYFSQEGYYAKNDPRQRRASFWHGAAAAALGMAKHVSPRAFERILLGYVPGTDIRLGRVRDGEHQHRPGFDLTLSAPKTVSLEALLYGDRRVLGAHDAAVKATLDWLERDLLQTRSYDPVTRQRLRVAANGLVAAGFRHLTSRDEDRTASGAVRPRRRQDPVAGPRRPATPSYRPCLEHDRACGAGHDACSTLKSTSSNPVSRELFGLGLIDVLGYTLMMTEHEKAALDCIDRQIFAGSKGEHRSSALRLVRVGHDVGGGFEPARDAGSALLDPR